MLNSNINVAKKTNFFFIEAPVSYLCFAFLVLWIWEISFGYRRFACSFSMVSFRSFFKFQNYTLKFSLKIQILKLSGKSNNILWQNSAFCDFGSIVLWKLNSASYRQNSIGRYTPQTKILILLLFILGNHIQCFCFPFCKKIHSLLFFLGNKIN